MAKEVTKISEPLKPPIVKRTSEADSVAEKLPESSVKLDKNASRRWWIKDLILAVVNIAFLAALTILLGKLPNKAAELSQLKSTYTIAAAKREVEIAEFEIEESRLKAEALKKYFPDQSGLANFAAELDALRGEGLISSFSFASEDAIRDQTGYYGVPIVIRFLGNWELISQGLSRIGKLPYLIRAVNIESAKTEEDNLIDFRYGGFLYVDESLAKTR